MFKLQEKRFIKMVFIDYTKKNIKASEIKELIEEKIGINRNSIFISNDHVCSFTSPYCYRHDNSINDNTEFRLHGKCDPKKAVILGIILSRDDEINATISDVKILKDAIETQRIEIEKLRKEVVGLRQELKAN